MSMSSKLLSFHPRSLKPKRNVSCLTFGLHAGWLSPLQPSLQAGTSALGLPPLTDEDISWIGSIPSIIMVVTPPIFGFCLDRFGRKFTLLLTTLPNLLAYGLLMCASNITMVHVGRIVGGFCSCGSFIVCPIYISETVMEKWRGTLCGITGFCVKVGIIISFFFGSYTSYLTLNLVSAAFTVVFLLFSVWLPESPVFLVKRGKWLEAEAVLRKLWGDGERDAVTRQMQLIQRKMCEELPRTQLAILKQFLTTKQLRTALVICAGVFTCQVFSGYPAIVRYSVDIFDKTGVTYSPHIAAILLAVAQLVFSFTGALIVDKTGRKRLLLGSLGTMALCTATLSIFLYIKHDFPDNELVHSLRFLPTISLLVFIAAYSTGFGTVPFIIIPELCLPDTRATASTVSNLWYAVCEFIVLKLFPTLTNLIQLSGTLAIHAVISTAGGLFLFFVMFETMHLDSDEIQSKLRGEKHCVKENRTTDSSYSPVSCAADNQNQLELTKK